MFCGARNEPRDRASGKIYWSSESEALDEELPEDIEDGTCYVAVPDKRDLDLGRELARMGGGPGA